MMKFCTNSKCLDLHDTGTPCAFKAEEQPMTLERAEKTISALRQELIKHYKKTWT